MNCIWSSKSLTSFSTFLLNFWASSFRGWGSYLWYTYHEVISSFISCRAFGHKFYHRLIYFFYLEALCVIDWLCYEPFSMLNLRLPQWHINSWWAILFVTPYFSGVPYILKCLFSPQTIWVYPLLTYSLYWSISFNFLIIISSEPVFKFNSSQTINLIRARPLISSEPVKLIKLLS